MLLLTLTLAGCAPAPEPIGAAADPRVLVEAAAPPPRTLTRTLLGVLEPRRDAALSALTGGQVHALLAAPGDRVTRGQPLLQLDPRQAAANLTRARAALADAEAVSGESARRLERLEALGDGASPADLDAARTAALRAGAAAEAARAAAELAALELSYKTVSAPFDRQLAAISPEVGEVVAPGAPVARVVDVSALTVTGGLLEDELGPASDPGSSFSVRAAGGQAPASLRHLAPVADPRSLDWPAELEVPGDAGLVAGAAVQVIAELAAPAASAAVPLRALSDGAVWVVVEGAAWRREARAVAERGDRALIEGVSPGEPVVIGGAERLEDGQRVQVVEAAP